MEPELNVIGCNHRWKTEQLPKKKKKTNEEAVWALTWNNYQEILLSDKK